MRIILRGIAILSALSVVATILFMISFGAAGWSALLNTGLLGVITIFGWAVTLIVGPLAAVQLFRLKESGRIAAIVLFASMMLYYVIGLLGLRTNDAPLAPIVTVCVVLGLLLAILASPSARDTCTIATVTRELTRGG